MRRLARRGRSRSAGHELAPGATRSSSAHPPHCSRLLGHGFRRKLWSMQYLARLREWALDWAPRNQCTELARASQSGPKRPQQQTARPGPSQAFEQSSLSAGGSRTCACWKPPSVNLPEGFARPRLAVRTRSSAERTRPPVTTAHAVRNAHRQSPFGANYRDVCKPGRAGCTRSDWRTSSGLRSAELRDHVTCASAASTEDDKLSDSRRGMVEQLSLGEQAQLARHERSGELAAGCWVGQGRARCAGQELTD